MEFYRHLRHNREHKLFFVSFYAWGFPDPVPPSKCGTGAVRFLTLNNFSAPKIAHCPLKKAGCLVDVHRQIIAAGGNSPPEIALTTLFQSVQRSWERAVCPCLPLSLLLPQEFSSSIDFTSGVKIGRLSAPFWILAGPLSIFSVHLQWTLWPCTEVKVRPMFGWSALFVAAPDDHILCTVKNLKYAIGTRVAPKIIRKKQCAELLGVIVLSIT